MMETRDINAFYSSHNRIPVVMGMMMMMIIMILVMLFMMMTMRIVTIIVIITVLKSIYNMSSKKEEKTGNRLNIGQRITSVIIII